MDVCCPPIRRVDRHDPTERETEWTREFIRSVELRAAETPGHSSVQVYTLGAQPHEIKRFDTEESTLEKIDAAVRSDEMYDDSAELRPTEDLIREVKQIIREAKHHLPEGRFPIAVVRPFDGSIRITWNTESGSVRLIYTESASGRYIFYEETEGDTHNYGIVRDVTPLSLAKWLRRS